MLEELTLPSFTWRKPKNDATSVVRTSVEVQTSAIEKKDAQTEANNQIEVGVQTDEIGKGEGDARSVKISQEVVDLLFDFVHDDSRVNYNRLLEFHRFEKIDLEVVHRYHIETRKENVLKMLSSSSRKTVILIGSESHDTFCSHQARAIICSSTMIFSIPLATCALSAAFVNSYQIAVAELSGFVKLCTNGEILYEQQLHNSAITCVEMTKHGMLSAADNGEIALWGVGKTAFERLNQTRIVVADLPRKIRKSSTSTKPVAIVSIQAHRNECCVATETGGLYVMGVPSLQTKIVNHSPESIRQILYYSPLIAVVYHSNNVRILTVERIIDDLNMNATHAIRCGSYFIFSNSRRLLLWSIETRKTALDIPLETVAISSIGSDVLQLLDANSNLVSYFINDKL
ncbi:unnamed protein product [Caenorhabditis bovis]|uniref:Uncharacterized protein n=1 Tax=Caenorhabditis bovis TaxID=2654633 RepID=A0A8S1FES2_9PELO|nr:unnamed protein product [Caenorhabditis bovis]